MWSPESINTAVLIGDVRYLDQDGEFLRISNVTVDAKQLAESRRCAGDSVALRSN